MMNNLYEHITSKYDVVVPRALYFDLARLYFKRGKFQDAVTELENCISEPRSNSTHEPENWELHYLMALCNRQIRGEEYLAVKSFTQAAWEADKHKDSLYWEAQQELTITHTHKLKSWAEEITQGRIKDMNRIDKVQTAILMGRIYLYSSSVQDSSGILEKARDCFNGVLQVDPANSRAIEGLAEICLLNNEQELAISHFNEAKELAKNIPERAAVIGFKLIKLLIKERQYEQALEELKLLPSTMMTELNLYKMDVLELEIRYALGDSLLQDNLDSAVKQAQELSRDSRANKDRELKPYLVMAHQILSKLYIVKTDFEAALATVSEAMQMDRSNTNLILIKAQALIEGASNIEEGKSLLLFIGKELKTKISLLDNEINQARKQDIRGVVFLGFVVYALCKQKDDWSALENYLSNFPQKINEPGYHLLSSDFYLEQEEPVLVASKTKAAISLWKAGVLYSKRDMLDAACFCFVRVDQLIDEDGVYSHAFELNPQIRQFDFEYANALQASAKHMTYPYYDKSLLHKAAEIWERQRPEKFKLLDRNDYWYLIVIGSIKEYGWIYDDETPIQSLYWQALLYTSRAVMLNRNNHSLCWMARFYRQLDLQVCTKFITDTALKIDGEYTFALEESANNALSLGDLNSAKEFITQLKKSSEDENYLSYYIASSDYQEGKYHEALLVFEKLFSEEADNIWEACIIAHTYNRLNQPEKAKQAAKKVLAFQTNNDYQKQYQYFGWAEHFHGNYEDAQELFQQNIKNWDLLATRNDLLINILANGLIEQAEEYLNYFLKWNHNLLNVKDLINDLEALEWRINNQGSNKNNNNEIAASELHAFLYDNSKEWKKKLLEHSEYIKSKNLNSCDELTIEIERLKLESGSTGWLACMVGIAWAYREKGEYTRALEYFEQLLPYCSQIPELKQTIISVQEQLIEIASRLLKENSTERASDLLHQIDTRDNPELDAKKAGLLLVIKALTKNTQVKENEALIRWFSSSHPSSEISAFVEETSEVITSPQVFWKIYDLVVDTSHDKQSEATTKAILHRFPDYWSNVLDKGETRHQPEQIPIIIWLASSLIPKDTGNDWIMIKIFLHDIRRNIADTYGIVIPSVKIRDANNYKQGEFAISFNQVPLVFDTVPTSIQQADKAYDDCRESMDYISGRLEALFYGRLSKFFTIQDASICKKEAIAQLTEDENSNVENCFQNPKAMNTYKQMLSGLLEENISIADKKNLLLFFAEIFSPGIEKETMLRKARFLIKPALPANLLNQELLPLSGELEQEIKQHVINEGGKTFLAIEPQKCQQILGQLRDLIPSEKKLREYSLSVEDTSIRYYIRNLVKLEFPELMVVAKEELLN